MSFRVIEIESPRLIYYSKSESEIKYPACAKRILKSNTVYIAKIYSRCVYKYTICVMCVLYIENPKEYQGFFTLEKLTRPTHLHAQEAGLIGYRDV